MVDADIVLNQLNHYKPLIDRATQLTVAYVSEHKLILTGGMAIDLALRVKNESIYDDDTLPDYDIISDENLLHANALAEIFCKEGLPDINVINAVHITTVKVRMRNIVFLDATYIPPSTYKQIPYLDVGHLRIMHPHYLFIDQRSSLSQLMVDTGISLNVFNRLSKDVKRNMKLRNLYPIQSTKIKLSSRIVRIPIDLIKLDESALIQYDKDAAVYTGPTCISGYVGYVLMMIQSKKIKNEVIITDSYLEISVPDTIPVSLLTCDVESIKSYIKKPTMYRPLVNLKSFTMRDGDIEYIDTYGQRNSCNFIELTKDLKVCVASVDYLLMEFLRDRIFISEEPYSEWYLQLVDVVDQMRELEDSDAIWWPSLNCYGRDNLPEYRMSILEKLMSPEESNALKPKSSYLKAPKCVTKKGFIPEDSHYFQIDGRQDNTIKHTNYKFIMEEFDNYLNKKRQELSSSVA